MILIRQKDSQPTCSAEFREVTDVSGPDYWNAPEVFLYHHAHQPGTPHGALFSFKSEKSAREFQQWAESRMSEGVTII